MLGCGRVDIPTSQPPNIPTMSILVGRFFQLIGMILLPLGLLVGLFQNNIALEVRLLFIGGGFFLVGWLMARKKE